MPFLEKICSSKHEIAMVLTKPDMHQGRGKLLLPNPVKELSLKLGLNYVESADFNENVYDAISGIDFDYLVVVSFGKIIPDVILKIAGERTINVHPSILPRHRGPSPITTAILKGDKKTGVTFTKIKKKFDTGDIYLTLEFAISQKDNKDTLEDKIIRLSSPLLVSLLDILENHDLKTVPQSKRGVSYTRIFTKNDFKIDWTRPSSEITNKVRAFSSEPGCFTIWKGKVLKILSAESVACRQHCLKNGHRLKCGQVLKADSDGLIVKCMDKPEAPGNDKDLFIQILELKPEGKKRMSYIDFINGYRIKTGEIFE